MHIRIDGPGFDSMDVPDGSDASRSCSSPAFVPTADFFRHMRRNQAALDLVESQSRSTPRDNGLERFMTSTRRQNFLSPPRRHRAFPLRGADLTHPEHRADGGAAPSPPNSRDDRPMSTTGEPAR